MTNAPKPCPACHGTGIQREVPACVRKAREDYRRSNIMTRRYVRAMARRRGWRIPFTNWRWSTSVDD